MKKTILTAALLAASALSAQAQTHPLPACNDPAVKTTFLNMVQPASFYELKDWQGASNNGDKHWCYAYFAGGTGLGVPSLRSPFMEAVFTLEWVNENDGRWWLQIRKAGQSCRGVMGNPLSRERCQQSEPDPGGPGSFRADPVRSARSPNCYQHATSCTPEPIDPNWHREFD